MISTFVEIFESLISIYRNRHDKKMKSRLIQYNLMNNERYKAPIFRNHDNPNQTHVGKKIREYRELRSMTLTDLANKTGINSNTLNHYESGVVKNVPFDKLKKIIQTLHVTWNDVLPPLNT